MAHYLQRVREQLVREISVAISSRVRDPRVPLVVSVTDVKLAPDTRDATVFVSVFGDDTVKADAIEALNHAAPFVQNIVAERVRIRHFPKLVFRLDTSIEQGAHIEHLLREVKDDLV